MAGCRRDRSIESRPDEGLLALRVRDLPAPTEAREFAPAAFPHGQHEGRVAVAHEVEKWPGLAVLLSHEEQRHVRRQQQQSGAELLCFEGDERGETLATRAVAHLIVVLREYHEALGRSVVRRRAMAPAAELRMAAAQHEAVAE